MKDSCQPNENSIKKPAMLLHVCCANCLLHPFDVLRDSFEITLYFYNPNIHPEDEYKKRLYWVKKISGMHRIPLITGKYDTRQWFDRTGPYKNEPEGSKRCEICFSLRLEKTANTALEEDFDIIATTLSVSLHKNSEVVNKTGTEVSAKHRIPFYTADFKKDNGYRKTMELSQKYSVYRQNYCGCLYSIRRRPEKSG